jgi:hypothetical protein
MVNFSELNDHEFVCPTKLVLWQFTLFIPLSTTICPSIWYSHSTGTVSWVHHILCPIGIDDKWFTRYLSIPLLLGSLLLSSFLEVCFVQKSFCACNLNVFLSFNAVIYRWQQAVSNSVLCSILAFLNFAYTLLVLNYSCIGFQVSSKLLNQALVSFISCQKSEHNGASLYEFWERFFHKILTSCYGPYLWCTYDFALGFIFTSL